MKRKQHPYSVYSAPIEVRYAARVMGRDRDPYVSFETLLQHFGLLENGLAQLRSSTLYKGYKAKLAAHETARQRLVVTAWEIEESECFTAFLDALHDENKERLGFADRELQSFRSIFSDRGCKEVEDDKDYLQAIYEDECEIPMKKSVSGHQWGARRPMMRTRSVAIQALPIVYPFISPFFSVLSLLLDDISLVQVWFVVEYYADIYLYPPPLLHPQLPQSCQRMPAKRARGKTTISKPTRGSGLNPSHVPADSQMHLSDEQPHEPMPNAFNPHEGLNSYAQAGYAPFTPAHDVIDTHAGPSNAYAGPSSAQAGYAPFTPAHDVIDTYAGPSNTYEDYDLYSSRHLNNLSHFNSMQAPNPHHIQLPQSFDDEDEPTEPQRRPLPITTGEISQSHVIHTAGPARSSNTRRRTRKLPATPYIAHETVVSATMQAAAGLAEAPDSNRRFQLTGPMREQIFNCSKELVVGIVFMEDAMASSPADKERIVKSVIRNAMPKIPGLRGTPRWDNQKKDLTKIWRAVLIMRTELTTLTREGVVLAYKLFPPQGSLISPEAFRIERVRHLIQENKFMHEYSFNADGTLKIHSKFKNPFILHLVTRLVWNMRFRLDTLLISPCRELHYVMGAAGTFTKCILLEQGHATLTASKVSSDSNSSTFQMLCSDMDSLTDEEKAELDGWKDHMVICGISQQRVGNELSDFDLSPADLERDSDADA
ncbi:uncharacterized protein HD556DRAFT_1313430 [Suillus plorans]|uniref:DUF6532 domain-containing protein n=1 Tax=Suillus plorans TaxID=116603 RepID=A0A9P7ACI9_9AGAM|nr:uncharacterized protein HD556DRAFT_1313430 [Suillus plorans]KAG1786552.1 hypothetical protein HD556DRAFT_1313430 [Suillus plorans]